MLIYFIKNIPTLWETSLRDAFFTQTQLKVVLFQKILIRPSLSSGNNMYISFEDLLVHWMYIINITVKAHHLLILASPYICKWLRGGLSNV